MSENKFKVTFTVDQLPDGRLQLSINGKDFGYRIAGPTYIGTSKTLLRHELTLADVDQIQSYLDAVERP